MPDPWLIRSAPLAADVVSDDFEGNRASAWIFGAGLAGLFAWYGVKSLFAAEPSILGGTMLLSIGVFLHFHCLWTRGERLFVIGYAAKSAALFVLAGCIVYHVYRILIFG